MASEQEVGPTGLSKAAVGSMMCRGFNDEGTGHVEALNKEAEETLAGNIG